MAKDDSKKAPAVTTDASSQPGEQPPAPPPDNAPPVSAAAPAKEVIRVAPGHSVSSLRGIVPAGEVVSARDFFRGDADLKDLAERGALVSALEPVEQ